MCMLSSFSRVQLFGTPRTVAHQASLSLGFSRQGYWSRLPCSPPRDRIRASCSSCTTGSFFATEPAGEPGTYVSVQFSSVAQSCPTLCDPMNRSTPGLPVHHQLPEFTQTHIHPVSDAIQPSHPLSSPSPPAPNPAQHQSLFQ